MVESMEFLDFCMEPVAEKNAIPLQSWQTISLSDIWIPSHLLVNRNKSCNTGVSQGLYHTLQKKDTSKYSESFSVYIDYSFKNEQEDIFLSDSDEDTCNSAPMNLEHIKSLSDNLTLDSDDTSLHFHKSCKSFNHREKKGSENENNNAPFRGNDDNMYSNFKTTNVNNLHDDDDGKKNAKTLCIEKNPEKSYRGVGKDDNIKIQNTEKIDFSGSHSSSAPKDELSVQFKDFKNVQTLKRVHKDSDSQVSLKEIINDTTVASLKDFDFEYKKKDPENSSICDKQKLNSKKSRKDKKVKKIEKCVPLESLFEDMNTTQEYNCNKYMNNILRERERYARIGDNPLCSKEEYPDLTPEELAFINSDNTLEAENVKREKHSRIGDNSLCDEENLDLTSEELAFIYSNNLVKEENVVTPTFSFIHSDQARRELCPTRESLTMPNYEILNDLNTEVENVEVDQTSSNFFCGKIVIENIPLDVSKDDISSILCGYGEIKNFSMISTGKCLKVFVEIDLICDIDWVIECLNGSEPFGTSTGVLKCYQQTE